MDWHLASRRLLGAITLLTNVVTGLLIAAIAVMAYAPFHFAGISTVYSSGMYTFHLGTIELRAGDMEASDGCEHLSEPYERYANRRKIFDAIQVRIGKEPAGHATKEEYERTGIEEGCRDAGTMSEESSDE